MNAASNCASHVERADIYSSKRMLPHFKEYVLFNEQVPFRHNKSIQFPNYVKQSCRSIADMEHHVQMPLVMQLISLDTWQMPTKRKPQKPKDTQQKWVKVLSQSVGDIGLFFCFCKGLSDGRKGVANENRDFVGAAGNHMHLLLKLYILILYQSSKTCISIVYKNILPMTMMPRSAFFIYVLFI